MLVDEFVTSYWGASSFSAAAAAAATIEDCASRTEQFNTSHFKISPVHMILSCVHLTSLHFH
jgi:hypothetical protein